MHKIGSAILAAALLVTVPVGVHAVPAGHQTSTAVSAVSKLKVKTTTHNEVVGSLNRKVLVTQYRTADVTENNGNRVLKKVRILAPPTLRVDAVKITIRNVVDGRMVEWRRDDVPVGKWLRLNVVCLGECAVVTEVHATTLGRWWDRPHYASWPGLGV